MRSPDAPTSTSIITGAVSGPRPELGPPSLRRASTARSLVLVAAADEDLRGYLVRCLAPLSGRVQPILRAADGPSAHDRAIRLQVDLVIADRVLPGLDGWALARRLGASRRPPQVLVLTDDSRWEQRHHHGVANWLEKPFDQRTICRCVDHLLTTQEPR